MKSSEPYEPLGENIWSRLEISLFDISEFDFLASTSAKMCSKDLCIIPRSFEFSNAPSIDDAP